MIGSHPLMHRLFQEIRTAAVLPIPVAVEGATGTGKELVVRALHQLSVSKGRLIAVNMAALPESLAEAELFGSVRGAFTGATERAGWIEQASGGTLYLDEAGEASPFLQAKLLRVLESGVVHRIGCRRDRPVNLRLVVSTQEPAAELVAEGRWRNDFYYRVAGALLRVPSLRQRGRDILALTDHFLSLLNHRPTIGADLDPLLRHPWPGNVRELKRLVERAVCAAGGAPVDSHHLTRQLENVSTRVVSNDGMETQSSSVIQREELANLLSRYNGDTAAVAMILGLSRSGLYYRLRRLGIPTPRRSRIPAIAVAIPMN